MTKERVGPICPEDVISEKLNNLPDEVLVSFNELIALNLSGTSATILQSEVVKLMVQKGLKRADIYKNGWLDVEDIYRKAGWRVDYDKPGYNESYEPSFTFRRPRRQIDQW